MRHIVREGALVRLQVGARCAHEALGVHEEAVLPALGSACQPHQRTEAGNEQSRRGTTDA